MKKVMLKLFSIIAYLFVLLVIIRFDITKLISVRDISLVIVGTVILSLPHLKNHPIKEMGPVVGWNAMVTSYISTFILLFTMLSNQSAVELLMQNIAISCRPILYGFVIYVILKYEPEAKQAEDNEIAIGDEAGNQTQQTEQTQHTQVLRHLTNEEFYFNLQEKGLTQREIEIARLIIKGLTNGEIAEELCIAESTVKKHVSHIFEKLQISHRNELLKQMSIMKDMAEL